jgi:hypothetical protein
MTNALIECDGSVGVSENKKDDRNEVLCDSNDFILNPLIHFEPMKIFQRSGEIWAFWGQHGQQL